MSKKIIGITVGTTLPRPNFDQTDPNKGDYILGDRTFITPDDTLAHSGRPADAKATGDAISQVQTNIDETLNSAKTYTDDAVSEKADVVHTHDDIYYTEEEVDTLLLSKADYSHNHDSKYDSKGSASAVQDNLNVVSDSLDSHTGNTDVHVTTSNKSNWNNAYTHSQSIHARIDATKVADSTTNGNILIDGAETNVYTHPNSGVAAGTYKSVTVNAQGHVTSGSNPTTLAGYGITDAETKGAADTALASAKVYTDTVASGKSDTNHNHNSAYDAKGSADTALDSAKIYADSAATTAANKVKNDLLNGAGTAFDTLKELGDLITDNQDAIDALETVAAGKADKTHSHAISDVSGLQSALDGKAASAHGTHVSYSTTAPVMDGTASVGSASTVARSDHKHPTDTSRASKTEFDTHTANTTVHVTSTERSNWNASKTHADTAHAPSNAQANQNAFSNIKVGSTTIAADTTTDTLELVGSNVTITPDATNDKVTISVADASTGTKGIVQLTNSTASTSTTTAATPNSVKLVADLANTAKTNAATAQARADSAYTLAESKVDSLSDLGITATVTELNYVDGVTSNVQAQLDGKSNSGHTHNYAGSSSAGGAATSANKVNKSLIVKLNSGSTEGTNQFTFNGSADKSINITPSAIGASASGHSHDDRYYTEAEIDTKLSGKANTSHGNHVPATQTASNNTFLRNDNTWATVTPANIGAAASSHTHTVANITDLTATATELNYMDGVTSNVQTQLDAVKNGLQDVVYSDESDEYDATTPLNADTLGGRPASEFATKDELSALDASDVGAAPAGYGLGEDGSVTLRTLAEVDAFKVSGWRRVALDSGSIGGSSHGTLSCNAGDRYITQTFEFYYAGYGGYVTLKRIWYYGDSSWKPWEWANPPMISGTEYRTIERNDGEVVYAKRVAYSIPSGGIGNTSGSTIIEIPHQISNFGRIVRYHTRSGAYVLPSMNSAGGSTSINTVTGTYIKLQLYKDTWSGSIFFDLYYTKDA